LAALSDGSERERLQSRIRWRNFRVPPRPPPWRAANRSSRLKWPGAARDAPVAITNGNATGDGGFLRLRNDSFYLLPVSRVP